LTDGEFSKKADGLFGKDCLEAWSKLVLAQLKLGLGVGVGQR